MPTLNQLIRHGREEKGMLPIFNETFFQNMSPVDIPIACDAAKTWQLGSQNTAESIPFFLPLFAICVTTLLWWIQIRRDPRAKEIWKAHPPEMIGFFFFFGSLTVGQFFFLFNFNEGFVAACEGRGSSPSDALDGITARARQPANPPLELPLPPVIIPQLEQPLIEGGMRTGELFQRLSVNSIDRNTAIIRFLNTVFTQATIEERVEAALVHDGFDPASIVANRHRLRGIMFYPRGTAMSERTYRVHLHQIEGNGTRNSLPYRRVYQAIRNYELALQRRLP